MHVNATHALTRKGEPHMTRRIYVVLALVWGLFVGAFAHATASPTGPARYEHTAGDVSMPDRIVIRHCTNQEDAMAKLLVVEFSQDRVVYRCWKNY